MELLNLLAIFFLSVVFKIIFIYAMNLIFYPANRLINSIPNEFTILEIEILAIDAFFIGEMISTIRWNNKIIHILIIIHTLYLITYLMYLIFEAVD